MLLEKPLSTSRITVRNYKKADLPYLTAMWFDEENGKYMSDPREEYVDSRYQKALDDLEDNTKGYYLTIMSNDTREIIGSSCIFPDEKCECFDIGYCIHKDYWKKGLGTELIGLIKAWVISHGGTQITAEVAKDNVASNRLLIKNGFKVLRESEFKKYNMDICFESYIYSLSLDDKSGIS